MFVLDYRNTLDQYSAIVILWSNDNSHEKHVQIIQSQGKSSIFLKNIDAKTSEVMVIWCV